MGVAIILKISTRFKTIGRRRYSVTFSKKIKISYYNILFATISFIHRRLKKLFSDFYDWLDNEEGMLRSAADGLMVLQIRHFGIFIGSIIF